ncbi:ArdC family protein [Geobacter sp. AOG1]|uniref:ArdC family protein n=1 Tax=Geobacter sp. AOG1 TaxID=1566346 RepID=UPI001CC735EA|nr:zincin-like metallopeptidase domain-containing protein [Geobacter sp. AOG1]GFE56801.1 DNA primase [Geobacter sp. AOG1]
MNVYEIINNRIMELLEQGTIPWRKPWNAESNNPKNLISKKSYRGINHFLLSCTPYHSPYWLTFKQVQDKGGHVKKGERSTMVIFWKWLDKSTEGIILNETLSTSKIPILRYYNVFNIDQTEGISPPTTEETQNDHEPLPGPEQIIKNMPLRPELRFGGNKAYYSPSLDYIQLPNLSTFDSPEEYYSTLFHELVHSTGHISRLGRKSILEPSYFGSHEYSKEELVAEMGAAFLCGYTGIEQRTIENSAAYIQGWLRELKNDKTLLIHAAAQAQKGADYILNKKEGEEIELVEAIAA